MLYIYVLYMECKGQPLRETLCDTPLRMISSGGLVLSRDACPPLPSQAAKLRAAYGTRGPLCDGGAAARSEHGFVLAWLRKFAVTP